MVLLILLTSGTILVLVYFAGARRTARELSLSLIQLTAQMAEYFEGMLEILHSTKATVDNFVGDAIVAFWGAPNPDANHARNRGSAAPAPPPLLTLP